MQYFRFPRSMQKFIYFEESKQLPNVFRNELKKAGLTHLRHKILKTSGDKVYVKCDDCDWMLNYNWNKFGDDSCTLNRFVLYHKHNATSEQRANVTKHEAMESLYRMGYRLPKIQSYLQFKCGIQPSNTHNLYYKYRQLIEETNIPSFQKWYQQHKHKVTIMCYPHAESTNHNPAIVFVTCRQALQIHKERGHLTGIKIIPQKISQLSNTLSQYICVMFYGILANQNRILYAYAIYTEQHDKSLYTIIKVFLKLTGKRCESLFTDDEFKIKEILDSLKKEGLFTGEHYLDPTNYLRVIDDENIHEMMFHLLKSKTEEEYHELLRAYSQEIQIDGRLHEEIQAQKQRYCIWTRNRRTFIGNWFQKTGNKYHRLLVDSIYVKRSYTHMLIKIQAKFAEQRNTYEKRCELIIDNTIVENTLPFDWIRTYRIAMYKEGFREFMRRFYRSCHLDCEKLDEQIWQLKENEKYFKVTRADPKEKINYNEESEDDEDNKRTQEQKRGDNEPYYKCTCDEIIIKGLPCSHLLKILHKKKLSFFPYISRYWRLKKDYEMLKEYSFYERGLEVPKRGRPKRSKRNTQRNSYLK